MRSISRLHSDVADAGAFEVLRVPTSVQITYLVELTELNPKGDWMQFLVIGLDGTDADAKDRRLVARPRHIESGEKLRDAGHLWYWASLFDDEAR